MFIYITCSYTQHVHIHNMPSYEKNHEMDNFSTLQIKNILHKLKKKKDKVKM